MKTIKKFAGIILTTSWAISIFAGAAPAYAQEPETGESSAPASVSSFTCEDLGKPDKEQGLIISIIEESIGSETLDDGESKVINCIRETNCISKSVTEDHTEGHERGATEAPTVIECTPKFVTSGCSPTTTPAFGQPGSTSCQRVQVFISQSGLGLLTAYLSTIYRWSAGVIGIVTVFYMIWGGIKIATAGDDTAAYDEAKKKIIQSIAGLVLLFLSAVILYTINPNFFTF